jgi:hypothetical protein
VYGGTGDPAAAKDHNHSGRERRLAERHAADVCERGGFGTNTTGDIINTMDMNLERGRSAPPNPNLNRSAPCNDDSNVSTERHAAVEASSYSRDRPASPQTR